MFLLSYYFYIVWQCYKLYAAIYVVMGVYGFTRTGVGFMCKCMRVVGRLTWGGFRRLGGTEKEKRVIEKGGYGDWIILDEESDSDGNDGAIEMIKRIDKT